jgi:hypothetical protein
MMTHTVSAWPSGIGGGDQFHWAESFAGSNPAVDNLIPAGHACEQ